MGMEMEPEAKADDRAWGLGRVVGSDIGTMPSTTRAKEDKRANEVHQGSSLASEKGSRIVTQQLKIKKCAAGDDWRLPGKSHFECK